MSRVTNKRIEKSIINKLIKQELMSEKKRKRKVKMQEQIENSTQMVDLKSIYKK